MHDDITLPSEVAQDVLRRLREVEVALANVLQVHTATQADNARMRRRIHDLEVLVGLEQKPPLPAETVVLQNVKAVTSRSSQKLTRILAKATEALESAKEPKP